MNIASARRALKQAEKLFADGYVVHHDREHPTLVYRPGAASRRQPRLVGRFDDLCAMLSHYGFSMRISGSSHRIISRKDVHEIINLQPKSDGKAKPYQVRQIADLLQRYEIK